MAHYFATALPGLEYVLEEEILARLTDAAVCGIERGKVYFDSRLPVEALTALRTADNLYRPLHRFKVGPHKVHLAQIEREVSRCDLSGAGLIIGPGPTSFKVNASRTGRQTYSRFEAAEAAARAVAGRHCRLRRREDGLHELEFRLDIRQDEAVFALRLTGAAFRYRTAERRFAPAALRPPVAHALVRLSQPAETDRFVDPCCGSGTILAERLDYPYDRLEGGDLSREAAEAAAENVGARQRVRIRQWDARRLPLDAGSVDCIVTNLPFGRQTAADDDLAELYGGIGMEMKRVLRPGGRALCLTDADAAWLAAAERAGFDIVQEAQLSLKGLHPTLYRLRKL